MASITKKRIKGHTYYYARECQRVNGKPKIIWQKYLGKLENIIKAVDGVPAPPKEVKVAEFGATAALCNIAQDVGIVDIINGHVPKRQQGVSLGHYLLMAALNRAISPTSKSKFSRWYEETILPRLMPVNAKLLTSKRFWDHMSLLDEQTIAEIEKEVSSKVISLYNIDLKTLVYDGTNFHTYINTQNPAQLPQRGHNKQKRNDLRQISLGLLVSTDFHIPLFHKIYAGNIVDSTIFSSITEDLVQRYQELARGCDHITLIFDKGNNSEDNIKELDETDYHFIGSLTPSHHTDLLEIDREHYDPIEQGRLKGLEVYRTTKTVFGQERTIVVTYNENLMIGQLRGFTKELTKARRELRNIQFRLRRRLTGRVKKGKPPTRTSITRQVKKIIDKQYLRDVMIVDVTETTNGLTLTYRTDLNKLARLIEAHFGKTILFTDNEDWTDEEIVLGYRAQSNVEDCFRLMKNPYFLGWSPMFHWTDQKIRVHAFYCIMALLLSSLLQRQCHHLGITISIPELLSELSKIREINILYPNSRRKKEPHIQVTLTSLNSLQKTLFDKLGLLKFQVL